MNQYVKCNMDGKIATVVIDRTEALNALNQDVLHELYETMEKLDNDPTVKVVILTGGGEKAFVAGADIGSMKDLTPVQAEHFSALGHKTMNKVATMRPFVIAAINGFALGGGCELAMACDMRVASTKARLGIPEVALGVIPGFGGTQRLPRLVGIGRAKEIMATGRQVKANEAMQIGLVNTVTEPEELMNICLELANKIAGNSTSAISFGKRAMNVGVEMDLGKALEMEMEFFALTFSTPDQKEGMAAFVEKRKAEF